MMVAKDKKKNKKFGLWGWLVAGLLLIGGGFGVSQSGLLGGTFLDNGSNNSSSAPQEPVDINESEQENNHVNITVSESDILWNNEMLTLDEVRERISEQDSTMTYTLTDDNAIKATYDSIVEVLEEQQLDYNEAQEQ